ncbi:MAG TPA: response regulator [Aggregatilineales bacterium]|nr:response regulator [Aggregatilineales bacterium]
MLDWQKPNTWSILIVDDEPDNLELVALYFNFLQANVKTAHDGREGLDTLRSFRPDLIILDLSMPHLDGWEMKAVLQADPALRDIPTIALTAHAMPTDKDRVRDAGFDGYLTKPISLPTLMDDLQKAVTTFTSTQENTDAAA